jgi:hypothetical protein
MLASKGFWGRRLAPFFVGLVVLCLVQAADAQLMMTGAGRGAPGGGGASISALTAASTTGVIGCPATIASGVTFAAGVVVVGFVENIAAGPIAPTGFTINGVSATQIGSTITDPSQTAVQMWYAVVGSGSGSIVATCGASSIGQAGISAWTITGYSSSTPTANSSVNGFATQIPDPQGPMSLTVSSGGVAAVFIGSLFHDNTTNPTTWNQATRDATAESGNASGNGVAVAGAHISSAGTFTNIEATGAAGSGGTGTNSWD